MKKAFGMITACFFLTLGNLYAQDTNVHNDTTSLENRKVTNSKKTDEAETTESIQSEKRISKSTSKLKRNNDDSFRDDSTDAAVGMSGLSTTPGVSTTTGAGGLGTNENTGENTSSDIYQIERKDSVRKTNKNKR